MKDIEQFDDGKIFALAYIDQGVFRLQTFNAEKIIANLNINEAIGIDDSTVPLNGMLEPPITCCFINSDELFVSLFHKMTYTNWHLLYSIS